MKKRLLTALAVLTGLFLLSASMVWAASAPVAPVAKTGQTTSYRPGDDGDYQKGVSSAGHRFIDNSDGTVTDTLTGLMWAKSANHARTDMSWTSAIDYANNLSLGNSGCGGQGYTDWRLPNFFELGSLRDMRSLAPALPTGYPFTNVGTFYWSSTTNVAKTSSAWLVSMYNGYEYYDDKTSLYYVWPVRGGY